MFHPKKARLLSFNQMQNPDSKMPDLFRRIIDTQRMGKPCLIVIEGKSQTGKSTLARHIAMSFDKNYKTFFQVKDIMQHLDFLNSKLEWREWLDPQGTFRQELLLPHEFQNKWTFFDEPQISGASKYEFWSARNQILSAYTSTFGFMHNHLIMALPNIFGISEIILTNITMRIKMISRLNKKDNEINRYALVYIPNEFATDIKSKYFWRGVETWRVPLISDDPTYTKRKITNFFTEALPEWKERLNLNKEWTLPKKIEENIPSSEWKTKPS